MSTVHYKFSSVLTYKSVTFNHMLITVGELKREIMTREKLRAQTSELLILNAQTKEEFADDKTLIPKNTSVLVHRVPAQTMKSRSNRFVLNKDRPSLPAPQSIKRSTGIPCSFLLKVNDGNIKGAMVTNKGTYVVPIINAEAYTVKKKERPPFLTDEESSFSSSSTNKSNPLPEYVLCPICREFITDAAIIPCCGYSFCDECIRTDLLESEEHACANCNKSGISPDTLCPNKALRLLVENFRKTNRPPWHKDSRLLTVPASSTSSHPSVKGNDAHPTVQRKASSPHDQQHSCHLMTNKKYTVKCKMDRMFRSSDHIPPTKVKRGC